MKSTVTLTLQEILKALVERNRPCSRTTLIRYLKQLQIPPVDTALRGRQKRYPGNSPDLVVKALVEPRMPTLAQLKSVRDKALKARRAA